MLIGVAPAAFAQTTHLQGRLLGYDGQPMELAHVYLIELSGRMPRVRFGDPTSQTARFAQLYEDKSKRRGAFDLDWYDDADSLYACVRHEPDARTQQVLLLDHIDKAKKWALEHPEAAQQDGLDAAYLPEPGLDRRPLVEARMALDGLYESVRDFRMIKGRAMPWLHGIAPGSAGDRVLVRFGVQAIPRAVLVDRDGTILRTDDLRGPDLLRTLEEVFGEPSQQED